MSVIVPAEAGCKAPAARVSIVRIVAAVAVAHIHIVGAAVGTAGEAGEDSPLAVVDTAWQVAVLVAEELEVLEACSQPTDRRC